MSIESTGFLAGSQIDAHTVDTYHAAATPTANKIPVLDANAQLDGSVLVAASVQLGKLSADLLKEIANISLSFETGEQTATKIYFPYKVRVNKIRAIVTKALADTDNGTIQGANSTGDSANGLITALASAALNTEYSVNPSSNNVVAADSYYKLTTAKTTPGGKVFVTIQATREA